MWRNFFKKFVERKMWLGLVLPVWVIVSFAFVQVVLGAILRVLSSVGVPFKAVNEAVFNSVVSALIYVLTIAMVIGLPWLIKKYRTSRQDLGLQQLPTWLDLLIAPAGFIVYIILSAIFVMIATHVLPFVDQNQVQNTGFSKLTQWFEYALAFVTLVVIAPAAEEVLFRGYLLGKLMKHIPVWLAAVLTSLLFAAAHGAWNVGIDVFALSLVLCFLRIKTKRLWPGILIHMIKNGLAFYLLFINPTLLSTLGG